MPTENGKCEWDRRCSCPAKPGRRALNGCDECPFDQAANLVDNETLMLYDVPAQWRATLKAIHGLPVKA